MTDTPPPALPQPAQPVQPSPTPTPASASAPERHNAQQYFKKVIKPKSEAAEKIVKGREQIEDKQSTEYWKERKKENENRLKEKPSKKEVTEEPKERRPVGRPRGGGRGRARDRAPGPGLEIPKQGLHRFGHATAGLDYEMFQGGKSLNAYADPFSMGTEMSGMASAGGNRRASDQMSVDFGRLSPGVGLSGFGGSVGNAKKAMKRDGNARGFSGYQDPFSGSAPAPRGIGSKPRGRPPAKKKQKKEKPARSLFNLRLF
ncbi:MAG: hypothetical protein WC294_10640 [Methanoregula sp.]|jgi:hypothetical protein